MPSPDRLNSTETYSIPQNFRLCFLKELEILTFSILSFLEQEFFWRERKKRKAQTTAKGAETHIWSANVKHRLVFVPDNNNTTWHPETQQNKKQNATGAAQRHCWTSGIEFLMFPDCAVSTSARKDNSQMNLERYSKAWFLPSTLSNNLKKRGLITKTKKTQDVWVSGDSMLTAYLTPYVRSLSTLR